MPAETRDKVAAHLTSIGVTIVKGTLTDEQALMPDITQPQLEVGVASLAPGYAAAH